MNSLAELPRQRQWHKQLFKIFYGVILNTFATPKVAVLHCKSTKSKQENSYMTYSINPTVLYQHDDLRLNLLSLRFFHLPLIIAPIKDNLGYSLSKYRLLSFMH
jgi:hypothetical protein